MPFEEERKEDKVRRVLLVMIDLVVRLGCEGGGWRGSLMDHRVG